MSTLIQLFHFIILLAESAVFNFILVTVHIIVLFANIPFYSRPDKVITPQRCFL